ncbi:hypothetical protein [Bacillus swezeyi]
MIGAVFEHYRVHAPLCPYVLTIFAPAGFIGGADAPRAVID